MNQSVLGNLFAARLRAVSIAFAVCGALCASAASANLLTNSTFDSDTSAWSADSGTLAWDSRDANNSATSGSALVTNNESSNQVTADRSYQCVAVTPQFTYTYSGSMYIPGGQTKGRAVLQLGWYSDGACSNGSLLGTVNAGQVRPTGRWISKSLTATAPGNAHSVRATLLVSKDARSNGASFSANFDNLMLTGTPGQFNFSSATYTIGEAGPVVTITVDRLTGSTGATTVDYATSDGTATGGSDYTTTSGTLSFADGEVTKTFDVPITDDALVEGDETFNVSLSNTTGGATIGAIATTVVTIVDNDVAIPGTLQFSQADFSTVESTGTGTLTVSRLGGSSGTVSVDWATSDGTAIAPGDYVSANGTLTWLDGDVSEKTITITVNPDYLVEPNETVNVTLSNAVGGTIGTQAAATLTIIDDTRPAGDFSFSNATYSVAENGSTATITINRLNGSAGDVTVQFDTSDGTATAGSDYTGVSGAVTFLDGDTTNDVTVDILDDTLVEGDETVNLALSNPTAGSALGSPSAAVLTIVDNDCPAAPTITSTPSATCAGQQASMTASAGPYTSYQWYFGTTAITGANSQTYTIQAVAPADAGSYSVSGISACGETAASSPVTLEVLSCSVAPTQMSIDTAPNGTSSNGNGVFEPGEDVVVSPTWADNGSTALDLNSLAANFSGPGGSTYSITGAVANYGTVNPGSSATCATCFTMSISNPATRPSTHWDATFEEDMTTTPGSSVAPKIWTVHVGNSFTDVPQSMLFYDKMEAMLHYGITLGCTATQYCPTGTVIRSAMAAFVARAMAGGDANVPASGTVNGNAYNCAANGTSLFADVPATDTFCRHIHYIASQSVTLGCDATHYCPSTNVRRDQMAAFISRAIAGGDANVPTAYSDPNTGRSYDLPNNVFHFVDMGTTGFSKYAHYIWAKGIIDGCTATDYCPTSSVTRQQMSKFIANAYSLVLYKP